MSVVLATLDGLQRPSLEALTPRLVERDELMAAGALSTFRMTLGQIAGPALAGGLLATAGLPATYAVDTATFVVSLAALRMMRAVPPPPEAEPPSLGRIAEGLRYAGSRQDLMGTDVVDIVAMFFGMPMALFPAAATHLGGAGVLGLLYAAPAAGSLIATATSGWTAHVHRHGAGVCVSAAAWGAGIVVFGVAPDLGIALLGLVVAGGADMLSGIFRMTIWNPDDPRPPARAAGGHRAGELLDRAAARERRVGRRRLARRPAGLDRLRRRALHRRRRPRGADAAGVLALRRP